MVVKSKGRVNRAPRHRPHIEGIARLASEPLTSDMARVNDDADLDKLVTRIHADLRAGRGSSRRPVMRFGPRLRRALRMRLGRPAARGIRSRDTSRWLVPVLIFAAVTVLVLAFGAH
jgi:hypothetical protein